MPSAVAKKKESPKSIAWGITPAEKKAMIAKAKAAYAAAATDEERQKAIGMPYSPWRSRPPLESRRRLREFLNKPVDAEARRKSIKRLDKFRASFGGRIFSDSTEIIRKMRDAEESIDYIDAADFIRKLRDAEDNC